MYFIVLYIYFIVLYITIEQKHTDNSCLFHKHKSEGTHAMKNIPPQLDVPERSVGLSLAFSPNVPSSRPIKLQITTSKIRQLRANPIAKLHTHTKFILYFYIIVNVKFKYI